MKTIITNAFSINMLPVENVRLNFLPLTLERAKEYFEPGFIDQTPVDWESAVGHPDTAAIMSELLGFEVPVNRINVKFDPGMRLLVGQYTGPRLEPGIKTLPDGATINWWLVTRA